MVHLSRVGMQRSMEISQGSDADCDKGHHQWVPVKTSKVLLQGLLGMVKPSVVNELVKHGHLCTRGK